jgi:hypothetical protein
MSTSIVIINGRTRIDRGTPGFEFIYEVTPAAPGQFIFGPVISNAEGRRLAGQSPPISVQDIQKQDTVIIEIVSSQAEVLIDESFKITMRIMIKRLAHRFQDTDPMIPRSPPKLSAEYLGNTPIEGLEGPDPKLEELLRAHIARRTQAGMLLNDYTVSTSPFDFGGFFSDKEPAKFAFDRRVVKHGGQSYFEYSVGITYTARELGDYVFGPATLKGDIPVRVDNVGRAETQPIYAVGAAATVRVVPPPDEGRPDSYIGVIGSNLTAEATLDAQTCRVGDPLTLTITVAGQARFDNATLLQLSKQPQLADRFRVYEDTAQVEHEDTKVEYEFTLRPQVDGTYELPPIDISCFNARARRYETTKTAPLPIRVNPTVQIQAADLIAARTNTPTSLRDQTQASGLMAPVSVAAGGAHPVQVAHVPVLLGIAGFGPALFLLCISVGQARRLLTQSSPARRRRAARSTALRGLAHADKSVHTSPRDARSALIQAVGHYVGALVDRPGASIAPPDVRRILRSSRDVEVSDHEELSSIFERHYNDHFGGSNPAPTLRDDISAARRILAAISSLRKSRTGAGLPAVIIFSAVLVPVISVAQESVHAFSWNQANSLLSAAETPDQYLSAAAVYQRLVDNGVRNGPLFYNLGTALLGAERYDDAIAQLLRAERFMGHDHDTTHNLTFAIAKRDQDLEATLPWYRVVLFWHYRLGITTRLILASVAFSVCWIALTLRLASFQRWRYVLAGALAGFAMFGYSAATDLYAESEASEISAAWLTAAPAEEGIE